MRQRYVQGGAAEASPGDGRSRRRNIFWHLDFVGPDRLKFKTFRDPTVVSPGNRKGGEGCEGGEGGGRAAEDGPARIGTGWLGGSERGEAGRGAAVGLGEFSHPDVAAVFWCAVPRHWQLNPEQGHDR